ncbi:MAG: hypothetical protein VYD50_01975 [Candidatus Thermoplasmatota archaeon]|nr:hypothetical protein [Candidatus Thermoplasmatota archaeon]
MTDWSNPELLQAIVISIIGISVMSWWLYSRISLKLREVEERKTRSIDQVIISVDDE